MNKGYLLAIIFLFLVSFSANAAAISNPAAVFCIDQGNNYEIRTDNDGNEYGVCITNSGKVKDEWDFYRANAPDIKPLAAAENAGDIVATKDASSIIPHEFTRKSKLQSDIRGAPLSAIDWRNYNGSNWVSSIKDQGGCGSCWAFAAVGITESKAKIDLNYSTYDVNLSEQDIVSCDGGSCSGGWASTALSYIKSTGVVRESCFAYTAKDNTTGAACTNKCANWQNENLKISDSGTVSADATAIKQAINDYGPITVYMAVWGSSQANCDNGIHELGAYTSGVYTHNPSNLVVCGLHEIAIVGYNDSGNYWICKNSWGAWGESGYFRVNYTENVLDFDAWNNDPYDLRSFFLDDSNYITSTDITTIPTISNTNANVTYAKSSTPINFTAYAKANSIKSLASVKLNGTSMSGNLTTGGTFSTVNTSAQLGCSGFEGNCTLLINATDDAGKSNANAGITITIDDFAPRVANITTNDTDGYVNSAQIITITVNVTDVNVSSVKINNSALSLSGGLYTITTNVSALGCTTNTVCNLTVVAVDGVGQTNNTEKTQVTVEDIKPTIQFVSPVETSGDVLLNRTYVTANTTASDTNLSSIIISMYNSTGLVNSTTTSSSPNFANFTSLADGIYYINATATDLASNTNTTETINITINTQPPVITSTSPADGAKLSSGTTSTTITLTTDETAICRYDTADKDFTNMTAVDTTNSTTHSLSVSGLENGKSYGYYFRCNNSYGNVANASYYLSFSVKTSSSGGGGGGGGGGGVSVIDTFDLLPGQSEEKGLEIGGGSLEYTENGETHTVRLSGIIGDSAEITITSDPIKVLLKVGETKQVDANGNGQNDLSITLLSMTSNSVIVSLKLIEEAIEQQALSEDDSAAGNESSETSKLEERPAAGAVGGLAKPKQGLTLIAVLAVVAVIVFFVMKKLLKPKHHTR